MEINILHYQPGDYNTLINIWEVAGLPYKKLGRDSREAIESEIRLNCNQFLFAEYGGRFIGSVIVTHDGRKGWINRLAILPDFRMKGVGHKLIDYAEEWLDKQGIGIYACLVEASNEESFAVFKKLGYIPFEGMHYLTKRKFPEI